MVLFCYYINMKKTKTRIDNDIVKVEHLKTYKRPPSRRIQDEKRTDAYLLAKVAAYGTGASDAQQKRMAGYSETTIDSGIKVQATDIYKERVAELMGMMGGSLMGYAENVRKRVEAGEHEKDTLAQNVKTLKTLIDISKALLPTIKQKTVSTDEQGNKRIVWQTINQ